MNYAFWLYIFVSILNFGYVCAKHGRIKRFETYDAYASGAGSILVIVWLYLIAIGGFP